MGNSITVASYNLFWWCVSNEYGNCQQYADGKGFSQLYGTIKANAPYDLIGFQECDNVGQVVSGSGLGGAFAYYTPPKGNDAPMAWNSTRFHQIEGPGTAWVAKDQYGDRHVNWVRLFETTSNTTILFANTHGPLGQCDGDAGNAVAANYLHAISIHRKPGDLVVFSGDFNCATLQGTIQKIGQELQNAAVDTSYNGADHVFSSAGAPVLSFFSAQGEPSDHQLLKVTLKLPGDSHYSGFVPGPPPTLPPAAVATPAPFTAPSVGCPAAPGNGPCCHSCMYNHYCPSNNGCYSEGQSGCHGGVCPAPSAPSIAV
eukprot:gb/GFBE01081597.1/.p1 GENE.gb/GFBE01081597.1/~~gb/GFBE01081597.1/.p1  ORF type:complete len:314 (+),score=49.84 gb/GFBE01081597.1/:1-942(+)